MKTMYFLDTYFAPKVWYERVSCIDFAILCASSTLESYIIKSSSIFGLNFTGPGYFPWTVVQRINITCPSFDVQTAILGSAVNRHSPVWIVQTFTQAFVCGFQSQRVSKSYLSFCRFHFYSLVQNITGFTETATTKKRLFFDRKKKINILKSVLCKKWSYDFYKIFITTFIY